VRRGVAGGWPGALLRHRHRAAVQTDHHAVRPVGQPLLEPNGPLDDADLLVRFGRHRPRHPLHRRAGRWRAVGCVEVLTDATQFVLRVAERDGLGERRGTALDEPRRQVEGDHGGAVAHAGQAPGGYPSSGPRC